MRIRPIDNELLGDSFVLLVPTESGFDRVTVSNVRVEKRSRISDYADTRQRDTSELVIFFDCVNSDSEGREIVAGMQAEYEGVCYQLTEVRLFRAESPHHLRMTAQRIGGG